LTSLSNIDDIKTQPLP